MILNKDSRKSFRSHPSFKWIFQQKNKKTTNYVGKVLVGINGFHNCNFLPLNNNTWMISIKT